VEVPAADVAATRLPEIIDLDGIDLLRTRAPEDRWMVAPSCDE
jgi:hypothetical protein